MRYSMITLLIAVTIFSCKKQEAPSINDSYKPNVQKIIQDTPWIFLSETRTGSFNERYRPTFGTSTIVFSSNGKAYPHLEGQWGLVYDYNLDTNRRKLNYKFIFYMPGYMDSNVQEADVKYISNSLLVLENSFTTKDFNGKDLSLTLVDSLVR